MYRTISPKIACIVMALFYMANSYILGNDRIAERNAWLCVLLSALAFLPVFFLFYLLIKKFPGKNLFEIVECIFGIGVRRVVAGIYAVYGVFLLSMSFNCFARFVSSNVLPDTPKYVMAIAIALCAAYLVYQGAVVMGKWGAFILPVVALFIMVSLIGSIPSLQVSHLFPIAEDGRKIAFGTYRYLSFPFGEPIILFSLLPWVRGKMKMRHWLVPWFAAALVLSISFARDTMVLGGALSGALTFSTNYADSITGYINFEQRTEVVTSLIPAAAGIMESAVILLFISQAFDAISGRPWAKTGILAGGVVALVLCFTIYGTPSALETRYQIWPLISVPLQVVIPFACLCVASVRNGLRRKILARRLKRQIM